jgi:phage-related baseplate assembly protein
MGFRFDPLDLSQLAAPDAIRALDFEAVLDARMQDLVARFAAAGVTYDVGQLETDPAKILQEVDAFRETLVNARINDAVLATSLAKATGHDLEVVAGNYKTARQAGESDDSLRKRAQLAWENLSIGGSYGGYGYQALSAAPAQLGDVAVYGHELSAVPKGEVWIVCLGSNPSGVPGSNVLGAVMARVSPRDVRKVNDNVKVMAITPAPYIIDATLVIRRGADSAAVIAAQRAQVLAYTVSRRVIAAPATLAGVYAALGGGSGGDYIVDVRLTAPLANVGGGPFQAPICTGIRIVAEVAQ